jgi:hypothetical protein
MRKQFWFHLVIVIVLLLLTACSQATPGTGAGTPAGTPPQAAGAAVATQDPNAAEMACTVVSANPTPGPTEASMFPPITEEDWVLGSNPTATMTIIEYSDYM